MKFTAAGAMLGALAVSLGAFGAHALKGSMAPELMVTYQTAVDYHFVHALLLVLIGIIARSQGVTRLLQASGWLVLAGVLLFSGSLYALTLTGIRGLGIITPFGGVAMIAGWLCLMMHALKKN
ncbi:DUF423 domain-containing protein [Spongorhabdus nitratireducens]